MTDQTQKPQGSPPAPPAAGAGAPPQGEQVKTAEQKQADEAKDKGDDKSKDTAKPAVAKKAAKGMEKKVWIILEENDEIPPTGLFVQHNGDPFLIATGEPVEVPERIIGILDAAIMTVAVTDASKRIIGSRQRMRYPYRRVSAPKVAGDDDNE